MSDDNNSDETNGLERLGGLHAVVNLGNGITDVGANIVLQDHIRHVCRIDIEGLHGDAPAGTGFLVGKNLVLTNWHVVKEAVESGNIDRISCRFDVRRIGENSFRLGLKVFVDKVLEDSPFSALEAEGPYPPNATQHPTTDELDYTLLKLKSSIGFEVLRTKDGARFARGWIPLMKEEPKIDPQSAVHILQHPGGGTVHYSHGAITKKQPETKTRLRYLADTIKGSSGSPCFRWSSGNKPKMDLVAIHNYGDPGWPKGARPEFNHGVPISLIRDDLKKKQLSDFSLLSQALDAIRLWMSRFGPLEYLPVLTLIFVLAGLAWWNPSSTSPSAEGFTKLRALILDNKPDVAKTHEAYTRWEKARDATNNAISKAKIQGGFLWWRGGSKVNWNGIIKELNWDDIHLFGSALVRFVNIPGEQIIKGEAGLDIQQIACLIGYHTYSCANVASSRDDGFVNLPGDEDDFSVKAKPSIIPQLLFKAEYRNSPYKKNDYFCKKLNAHEQRNFGHAHYVIGREMIKNKRYRYALLHFRYSADCDNHNGSREYAKLIENREHISKGLIESVSQPLYKLAGRMLLRASCIEQTGGAGNQSHKAKEQFEKKLDRWAPNTKLEIERLLLSLSNRGDDPTFECPIESADKSFDDQSLACVRNFWEVAETIEPGCLSEPN